MKELAECVGLWLAEGDRKTKYEITFTNNCWELIEHFYYNAIKNYSGNPRIYVYSPSEAESRDIMLENCKIKYYLDTHARRPYYILRLASRQGLIAWREEVESVLRYTDNYADVLRGFFAGEGNIKTGAHSNRTIRISQKQPLEFVDKILEFFGVTHSFSESERAYVITGIWNWKELAKIKLADLHPEKKILFWKIYNSYKEEHYPNHYVRDIVSNKLTAPHTTEQLSKELDRSKARIYDVLAILKKKNLVVNFRVRSKDWDRKDSEVVVISKIKKDYLEVLCNKRTHEIAKVFKVTWKSASRRLNELVRLGLAVQDSAGAWHLTNNDQRIEAR